ncbi:MAG: L,D-transpeptidase family protein [Bacillota bacterium]
MKILINLALRRLYLFKNDIELKSYPVAIGKPETPTPLGTYFIATKIVNPHLKVLGTRWMGLSKPSYGIHGTPAPWTIGTMASLGCVRMYNHDIEEIFPQVPIGTTVEIISGGGSYSQNPNPVKNDPSEAPQIPQTSPPPASQPQGQKYIVQQGDTLWRLSQRFGVSLDVLIKANNLKNPNVLHPGQELIIPR